MNRSKRIGIWMAVGLAAFASLTGGCSNKKQSLLSQENQELRDRLSEKEVEVQELQTRNSALQDENGELAAALEQLRLGGNGSPGLDGLPGVTVGTRAGGEVEIAVAGDVLFDSGSANLKSSAKQTLDRVAQALKGTYPGHPIRIEGYTDTDPIRKSKWKSNEHLSAERAIAVEQYLISRGISNEVVYSAAFGPAHQKGSKSQSRRVEIVVLAN